MAIERHARLFRNGRNQALRIPPEFELPGDETICWQDGNRLIVGATSRSKNQIREESSET